MPDADSDEFIPTAKPTPSVPRYPIDRLDDPRLAPYRDLRERNPTRHSGRFIAEGRLVTGRLLRSRHRVQSVLVERGREAAVPAPVPPEVDLLSVPRDLLRELVGFNFHRGMMACGIRPAERPLGDLPAGSRGGLVVAAGVQDPENLGSLIRTAVAFGISTLVLGPGTADPLARRVIRVSMAAALKLEFFHSQRLADDLRWLAQRRGYRTVATTLAAGASDLDRFRPATDKPLAILFGSEAHGLPDDVQAAATDRVTIPMLGGTDSLNIAVAAGIFLYALTRTHPEEHA